MYLVVGLGNPGPEYNKTKHNVGFEVVDVLAHSFAKRSWLHRRNAETLTIEIASQDVMLVKPLTFMNVSGEAVGPLCRADGIKPERVIVVHDELDFLPGVVRVKSGGGHGGHNGLRSLIQVIGNDFQRIRVGIGKPESGDSGADYVLSRFSGSARKIIDKAIEQAEAAVVAIIEQGISQTMNQFNRNPTTTT